MNKLKYKLKTKTLSLIISLLLLFSIFTVQPLYAIEGIQTFSSSIETQAATYTMADLNAMSDSQLISLIPTLKWNQITDLFVYNNDAYKFYSNTTRMKALIREIETRGARYTASDDLGLPTFLEIIRAGYYLAAYNTELDYLNSVTEKNRCTSALNAVVSNSNFALGTAVQDEIVDCAALFTSATFINLNTIDKFANIFKTFNNNIGSYASNYDKSIAVYHSMECIDYSLSNYLRVTGTSLTSSQYYRNIDSFINEIMKLSNTLPLTSSNTWLVDNALYYTGSFADYLYNRSLANKTLTEAVRIYPYMGYQYFQALFMIDQEFNGVDYNNKNINYQQALENGKAYNLPNTYTFDNGKVVIKAGAKVTEEKIKRLYWASKEVKAQFFRIYGSDAALEPGNADDRLEIILYNSPDHYDLNRFFYGIDTNNGGMYIEGDGRFFTYERTTQDSIYSLEELFRHEYTHYLQGRYLIPGLWNQSAIYQNERLTWYEEGGAELFAGSTRTEGIKPRKSMVSGIDTNVSDRYSLSKTMYAKYGNFKFYTYAFVFLNYLYQNDMAAFNELGRLIRTNNVSGYDSYRSTLSTSSSYNSAYNSHMQQLYDSYPNLTTPLVSDDYLLNHPVKDLQEVSNKIVQVANLTNISTTVQNSQFFNTFTLKGTYTGTASAGYQADWNTMNSLTNNALIQLSNEPWSGYKTLTAYFTNHRVNSNNMYEFDVTYTGITTSSIAPQNKPPVANINGPYTGIAQSPINFSSNGSSDADGNIASYLWNFGDNTQSTDANPVHTYSTSGTYQVSLTVTDNLGASTTVVTQVTVSNNGSQQIQEKEPNNSFATANGAIVSGLPLYANFSADDNLDYFYLNVTEPCDINIVVNNYSGVGLNWLLYKESDTNNYVAYPSTSSEGSISGSYKAQAGKYYLLVYKTNGQSSNYTLTATFSSNPTSPVTNKEVENNNTIEESNPIDLNSTIEGSLDVNDSIDNFTFDIIRDSNISIKVTPNINNQINWVLFKAPDVTNYYAYAQNVNGVLTKDVGVTQGKYYLRLYLYGSSSVLYEINIKS